MNSGVLKQLTATVHGDVHGIGFRANTKNNVDGVGPTGYVEIKTTVRCM